MTNIFEYFHTYIPSLHGRKTITVTDSLTTIVRNDNIKSSPTLILENVLYVLKHHIRLVPVSKLSENSNCDFFVLTMF